MKITDTKIKEKVSGSKKRCQEPFSGSRPGGASTPGKKVPDTFTIASSGSRTSAQWIKAGYAGGSWNGNGIVISHSNTGTYAVGYAEASAVYGLGSGGTATFSGRTWRTSTT